MRVSAFWCRRESPVLAFFQGINWSLRVALRRKEADKLAFGLFLKNQVSAVGVEPHGPGVDCPQLHT